MTLDTDLRDLQRCHVIIVSPDELWGDVSDLMRTQFKRNHKRIAQRIRRADLSVCPTRDLHRQYVYYAGRKHYTCGACEKLLPEVS